MQICTLYSDAVACKDRMSPYLLPPPDPSFVVLLLGYMQWSAASNKAFRSTVRGLCRSSQYNCHPDNIALVGCACRYLVGMYGCKRVVVSTNVL